MVLTDYELERKVSLAIALFQFIEIFWPWLTPHLSFSTSLQRRIEENKARMAQMGLTQVGSVLVKSAVLNQPCHCRCTFSTLACLSLINPIPSYLSTSDAQPNRGDSSHRESPPTAI